MPQLVKGGKHVFGWSHVSDSGKICIPEEAGTEYGFQPSDKILIMNGSRTSKGFAVTKIERIKNSPIFRKISEHKSLVNFQPVENGYVQDRHHIFTWSEMDGNGCFTVREPVLNRFAVHLNDNLLVCRGSGYALAFIKTGPIVEEALKHPELMIRY